MNKLLLATGIGAALFLSGCSQTTAFDFFSSDPYYEKAISNMQKVSLTHDQETKALLHAVYLNNVDPEVYKRDEWFYVAVHIIDDPERKGMKNLDYKLRMRKLDDSHQQQDAEKAPRYNRYVQFDLEEKKPVYTYSEAIKMIELEEHHSLRQTMPVRNQWNHFYLVRFQEDINASELTLSFENDQYGAAQLTFQKEK